MKYKSTSKLLFTGLFFLLLGVTFIFLENMYYQYLDEDGFLHESMFLPLGVFALIFGVLLLFIFMVKKILEVVRRFNE